jgi:hypothetical protein
MNARLLLIGLGLTLLAACGAPLSAFDPGVDAAKLRDDARERLGDPLQRAAAHQDLGWLCLLHDIDCADLRDHGDAGAVLAPATVPGLLPHLLRVLALQGDVDIQRRAAAWLDLADAADRLAATVPVNEEAIAAAEVARTLTAEALPRLAVRDRQGVLAAIHDRPQTTKRLLEARHPLDALRRRLALGNLLAQADDLGLGDTLPLGRPLQVQAWSAPVSRRLHTGLDTMLKPSEVFDSPPAVGPPASGQALELPVEAEQGALPASLRIGRYRLPVRDPGVYALRAAFETEAGPHYLVARAPRGLRLWLDGQPWTGDAAGRTGPTDRLQRGWVELTAGPHRLDVAAALGDTSEPVELDVIPASTVALAETHPPTTWPAAARQVALALLQPASPARSELATTFPQGPLAAWLTVEAMAGLDPQSTAPLSALDRVLDSRPDHVDAQVDRVAKVRDAGNPAHAWHLLTGLLTQLGPQDPDPPVAQGETRSQPSSPAARRADLALERGQVLLALGLTDDAGQEALLAVDAQPRDCDVWERALSLGLDGLDRTLTRQVLARTPLCPQKALSLAQGLTTVDQQAEARQALQAAMQSPALATEAFRRLKALHQGSADPEIPLLPWSRDQTEERWQLAQVAWNQGATGTWQRSLQDLLTGRDVALDVRQRALQAGASAPWQAWRREGRDIAVVPDDEALFRGASTAWLLDQEIVVLLPGGGALRRVHQIVRVLDDRAAGDVGEVRIGDGAELEFARTWMADGTSVPPAETADKETVSLRAVSAGTAVEHAQVVYVAPDDPATGATRLAPFILQSVDGPTLLAEFVVLVPDGVTVEFAASPSVPPPEVRRDGAYTAHIFRTHAMRRARLEPLSVRPESALPSVRVSAQVDLASVLEPWNEALAAWLAVRDDELDRWVAQARALPQGHGRWEQVAARLARAVQNEHGGGIPGRPDSALTDQKGDRASVLQTIARRLGTDACLVRVVPLARTPANAPPDPDDFGMSLVRLRVPGANPASPQEIWYDPGLEGGVLNHIRAGLRGRAGLLVGCPQTPQDPHVTVPALGEGQDRRDVQVELDWHADGRIEAVVRERLGGALGALVRALLVGSTEESRSELLSQLVGSTYPGMTLELVGLQDLTGTGPVGIEYHVHAPADPRRLNNLELLLYPDQLGQAYTAVGDRKMPLLFSHTLDNEVRVSVHSLGADLKAAEADVALDAQDVHFSRTSTGAGAQRSLVKRIRTQPAVVAPVAYPEWATALRRIDAAEVVRLTR